MVMVSRTPQHPTTMGVTPLLLAVGGQGSPKKDPAELSPVTLRIYAARAAVGLGPNPGEGPMSNVTGLTQAQAVSAAVSPVCPHGRVDRRAQPASRGDMTTA